MIFFVIDNSRISVKMGLFAWTAERASGLSETFLILAYHRVSFQFLCFTGIFCKIVVIVVVMLVVVVPV